VNNELALTEVTEFLDLCDASISAQEQDVSGYHNRPDWQRVDREIRRRLVVVEPIAQELAPHLVPELRAEDLVIEHLKKRTAALELQAVLEQAELVAEVMGPSGPQLGANQMHPWVWGVAASLWDDGYRREAVRAAATAVFDSHLRAKLKSPNAKPQELAAAFASGDPTETSPRLRLPGYAKGTDNWKSAHDGAAALGRGCAMAIRNLSTHSVDQPDEQTALEALASLSLFARWADAASVETA
jgi:hypothetical protein